MRHSRIKIAPTEGAAAYHCISRTVNGEWLFNQFHQRFGPLWAERFKSTHCDDWATLRGPRRPAFE
jgi:hypothetical protein